MPVKAKSGKECRAGNCLELNEMENEFEFPL
jgi:hypothetical protein